MGKDEEGELRVELRELKAILQKLPEPVTEPPWYVKAAVPLALAVAIAAVAGYFRLESSASYMATEIARIEGRMEAMAKHPTAAGHPVLAAAVARLEARVAKNEEMRGDVEAIRLGLCERWKIACRPR